MPFRWMSHLGILPSTVLLGLILLGGMSVSARAWQEVKPRRLVENAPMSRAPEANTPRYLAFQIFTGGLGSREIRQNIPLQRDDLRKVVRDLRQRIVDVSNEGRHLGFVVGPLAFDHSDDQVRPLMALGFEIALETGVAIGFHVDDSMFWVRLKELNTPENLEWLDWHGTVNTGRRLDWSATPTKIMPQLCINSKAVKNAVSNRAALIGGEVAAGVKKLHAAGKDNLFLGVIAGWETQIGRDFETGKYLGYHALTIAGYSADKPPADLDSARVKLTHEFVCFWAKSLLDAGVPKGKVYSHIAYMSEPMYKVSRRMNPAKTQAPYLQTINFSPPATAICDSCIPGLSTYPQPGHLEQWQAELEKHQNPPWASCEGTAIDPGDLAHAGNGMKMEGYLGRLFNHGAVMVNVFGWGVGDKDNPFRKAAENDNAIAAYRKFLRGEQLDEASLPVPIVPPEGLKEKIQKIQAILPGWIEKNGPARVKDHVAKLQESMKAQRFEQVEEAADAILKIIGK
jgi:hypothetical protein